VRTGGRLLRSCILGLAGLGLLLAGLATWNHLDVQKVGDAQPYDPAMPILRTPDARFAGLADLPFAPHYVAIRDADLGELRVHYLDEGPRDGEVILLVHGQATWSYSFRRMIPLLTASGYRVIAPDLVGFGRSDKPARWEDHTYQKHVDWLAATLAAIGVEDSTGFLFDWGGYFGLRVAVEHPEHFARLVLVTTTLPRGEGLLNAAWVAWWRRTILKPEVFPISGMVAGMTDTDLDAATLRGLDAPYPDETYKAGPRRMPMMIPATFLNPAAKPNRAAWEALREWRKPTLTLVSERLARRGFNPAAFHRQIPGCAGQAHATYPDTGFFLIEDAPEQLARKTLEFIAAN
jgi:haloalkane dehalogenase